VESFKEECFKGMKGVGKGAFLGGCFVWGNYERRDFFFQIKREVGRLS